VFAIVLIVYGIVALVTPLIPGSWLIFIGLEIFGIRLLWGERIIAWWRTRRGIKHSPSSIEELDSPRQKE
jgi:uncharacterized protein YqgC (DUF456 family)